MDSRYGSSSQGGTSGGYSSNSGGPSGGYSSNTGGQQTGGGYSSSSPSSGGYSSSGGYQQTGSAHVHRHGMFGGSHYHTTTYHSQTPYDPTCCCTIL